MPLCYFCGKEEETYSCPHCNIKFCAEHFPPQGHNCVAFKETSSFEVPEVPEPAPIPEPVSVTASTPAVAPPRRQPRSQITKKNRLAVAVILVAVSIVSIIGVVMYATGPQTLPG
ncbi:MAG: hypothetical protein KAJ08_10760, partial [Deltaproteobacteria bacterium]|nr:hypothetical protein [Deltaproteobacteria bacterium]